MPIDLAADPGPNRRLVPAVADLRSFLLWLVFPALLFTVVGATLLLLRTGLPRPAVAVLVLLSTAGLLLLLERCFPLHRAWNGRPEALDVALLLGNRLVDAAVLAGTLALLGALAGAGLAPRLWPTGASLPLQALLGILIGEGVRYTLHRLSHRAGWLWRVHRTHHEPERMYALNGPRLHPANQAWLAVANLVPMMLLGAPLAALTLAATVTVFLVLFQHANLCLPFAGWNLVFATPDVHRLHHRRVTPAAGVNYGIVLLLFDQLFGTYRRGAVEPGPDDVGLP